MKSKMNVRELYSMFCHVAKELINSEEYLTEIDLKIGDGDHGAGIAMGFKAVLEQLDDEKCNYIQEVFRNIGFILLDTMGGASGVIFGTMFISGTIQSSESEEAGIADFACIFRKSLEAIKKRGKAQVGDKTMVDALEPAVVELEKAARQNIGIVKGLQLATDGALKGMEYTKEVKAKFGRAKYYGEKAIGLQDAGATSVWIIFREMAAWANRHLTVEEEI